MDSRRNREPGATRRPLFSGGLDHYDGSPHEPGASQPMIQVTEQFLHLAWLTTSLRDNPVPPRFVLPRLGSRVRIPSSAPRTFVERAGQRTEPIIAAGPPFDLRALSQIGASAVVDLVAGVEVVGSSDMEIDMLDAFVDPTVDEAVGVEFLVGDDRQVAEALGTS
jgi:hypothetical protein